MIYMLEHPDCGTRHSRGCGEPEIPNSRFIRIKYGAGLVKPGMTARKINDAENIQK
jgi:hypothetical protein